ncbi:MAG: ComEC/Rec2 family competence protein [Ferruginibacter sp.]
MNPQLTQIPVWKKAPLIRLLLPLMAGMVLQWHTPFWIGFIGTSLLSFLMAFGCTYFFSISSLYHLRKLQGLLLGLVLACFGMLLCWQKDLRHSSNWYGHFVEDSTIFIIRINEPLVVKKKSYKAEAKVMWVLNGEKQHKVAGNILLYFSKDSSPPVLKYGDLILIKRPLQAISNSGNPGAFDYKRYAAFQLLYHQLFLKNEHWVPLKQSSIDPFPHFLFEARASVLNNLKKYLSNEDKELGIAEALLIGYKEDLDKDLVQAYTNTGVVHIIAISGLHLGLIFVVLSWLFNRTPGLKKSRHIKAVLLLGSLWLFALLTGGSASVLRSAVMFTVIVLGKYYFKQSSIYNSLAASAFILLCYNPYFLWDVGFQLSYLAVLGIVLLQKHIYRAYYFRYGIVRKIWEMMSVTLAAQMGAFPICIYYFHQFPNLFLFTNMLAVPLSTIILFGEILLLILSWIPLLANGLGMLLGWLIRSMNNAILYFDELSFSVWEPIYASVFSTWVLYALLVAICSYLIQKKRKVLIASIALLLLFAGLQTKKYIELQSQQTMIVYHVTGKQAVDFIVQDRYLFVGDSSIRADTLLQQYHLKPSRTSMLASKEVNSLERLSSDGTSWQFYDKKIWMLNESLSQKDIKEPEKLDVLLLSKNARVLIADLLQRAQPTIVVFDASNSLWKIDQWKKECEALNLRFHSVNEQGAFILII